MPYTAKQKRYFHAAAARGEPGMKRLAEESEEVATRPPVKPKKKTAKRRKR